LGARVRIIDSGSSGHVAQRAEILGALGAEVALGAGADGTDAYTDFLEGLDLLVVSPGLPPAHPWIARALETGIPVWGELELAWRLRKSAGAAEWLCVTGTNGKTTATLMLESILRADGLRVRSAGNIGNSLIDVVMHEELDAIAVEVGAPQLPFAFSLEPLAAACINIAEDHIDHFGSFDAYREAKARIYRNCRRAAVYNEDEPLTRTMVENADVLEGCRAVGITRGVPTVGNLGVVEGLLVDRAFIAERADSAAELAEVAVIHPAAPHNVTNALIAAALARAAGVSSEAVRNGLVAFTPAQHRIAHVADVNGAHYVDDSKATNTHAALASMQAYPRVVWIAGGLAKGQEFDEFVQEIRNRLVGVVLIGRDRGVIAAAMARHAPQVPVIEITGTETTVMYQAVKSAATLAGPGDTVLLAPGCASWDIFRDYAERGDVFAAAVAELVHVH
jgi:UDP-N-acetylmuramoylalanine--D-glutamate ligase